MNQIDIIPVFRNGTIVFYDKKYSDISWSYEENLEAASFFASCIQKHSNIQEQLCYSLTYMFIMNRKHPDMCFKKTDMDMIQSLIRISGK